MLKHASIILFAIIFTSHSANAQTLNEAATEKYFSSIHADNKKLTAFLTAMPKGGDLHVHLGGASMAENMIRYAQGDHLCVDGTTDKIIVNPSCSSEFKLDDIKIGSELYHAIVDAWSMQDFHKGKETGHDHFFATFGKYGYISSHHSAEILAEVTERAGKENESYLELMTTPDANASGILGAKLGWNDNWQIMRDNLLQNGINDIVATISKNISADESYKNNQLHCGITEAKPGCDVTVRYLYQVFRGQDPVQVFAQLLAGFEAVSHDTRIVGINLVQPEDGEISMRDYSLQMRMIGFLHTLYPQVAISLHAGELAPGLVPDDGLRFHIREAIELAHAQRIGHGVDVAHENNSTQLLQMMAQKNVMVEINLTSNADILNISGKEHPLPLYLQYNVPVALSTDDEGVERTNLSAQYHKAVTTYHFSYLDLKKFARTSLYFSFVSGASLWSDANFTKPNSACTHDVIGSSKPSTICQTFLGNNEKANLEWRLEARFLKFEENY